MLFKRRPKPPLLQAVRLVDQAVLLIHAYWRDRGYRPSEADLRLFLDLERTLFAAPPRRTHRPPDGAALP